MIEKTADGIRVTVHAQPGARKTELSGVHGAAIKIRVQAPPVDGKANDELVDFLARILNVARGRITLVRGQKSRSKIFEIVGADFENARAILLLSK